MDNNTAVIAFELMADPLAELLTMCKQLGEAVARHGDLLAHHAKVLGDHDEALVADRQQLVGHGVDMDQIRKGLRNLVAQGDSHESLLQLHTSQLRGVDRQLDGANARLDGLTPDGVPDAEIHCPNCDCPRIEGVWLERVEPHELLAVFKERLLANMEVLLGEAGSNMEVLLGEAGRDKTPNWWKGAKAAIRVVADFGPDQVDAARKARSGAR